MKQPISLRNARSGNEVGGKAASLGSLVRAGFAVPEGFVVTAEAAEIGELAQAILKAFDALESSYVAVRSSAMQEDGHSAAWAGQLDTYLNVPRTGLMDAIARCMESAGSERAKAYAAEKGLSAGRVAVIVQAMVPSDVSGVCFSIHPITQEANEVVVEAAYGLGEAVVSGEVTPDNYVVARRSKRIISKFVATQPKALRFSEQSRSTDWEPVPEPSTQKLSDTQILELADTAIQLEKHFGFPVDVEWAFRGDRLYILQSRPITTLA